MTDIITTTVFDSETFDGYPVQFRYNGSLTINIYTGLRYGPNEPLQDAVEIDIITLSEPGIDNALAAVKDYLGDIAKEGK